jgi:tRNA1(Val) A37 N6-methylase TrmN6
MTSPSGRAVEVRDDETLDSWGRGTLKVIQKKTGYRFSLDPLILFDFVSLKGPCRVLDLGTGCGILALLLARTYPRARILALDIEPGFIDLASRNFSLNKLQKGISLIRGDLRYLASFLKKGLLDVIVCNPPYRPLHSGRINPQAQKALARHEVGATLKEILEATAHGLRNGGKSFLIYPAWRLASLLSLSRQYHLEPKRMRLVYSFPDKEAQWVLLESVLEGGEELTVLPPLFVYDRVGVYSLEMQRVLALGSDNFSQRQPGPVGGLQGP